MITDVSASDFLSSLSQNPKLLISVSSGKGVRSTGQFYQFLKDVKDSIVIVVNIDLADRVRRKVGFYKGKHGTLDVGACLLVKSSRSAARCVRLPSQ